MEEALDFDRPLQEVLMRMYDGALSLYMPGKGVARGCFLIGTAATEAVGDPEIRSKLAEGLREFDRALEARLRHAQAQGELDAAADPAVLARIASAVLHTLAIRSRAGDSRAALRATADAAVQLICGTKNVARKKTRRAEKTGQACLVARCFLVPPLHSNSLLVRLRTQSPSSHMGSERPKLPQAHSIINLPQRLSCNPWTKERSFQSAVPRNLLSRASSGNFHEWFSKNERI